MLRLTNIKLKNFRVWSNLDENIDDDLILLNGKNGIGKSSISEAIGLALFDDKGKAKKLEDFIKWGTDSYEVELCGILDNKKFKITLYNDRKGKSTKELIIEGNPTPYKNSDAVKYLNSILDPKICLSSMLCVQNSFDIITTKPAERQNVLKKLYNTESTKGINDFDLKIKQLKDIELKQAEKELYHLQNKQYDIKELQDLPYTESEYESNKLNLEKNELKRLSIEKEIKDKINIEKDIKSYEDQLNSLNLDLLELKREKENNNLQITGYKDSLNSLNPSVVENEYESNYNKTTFSHNLNLKEIQDGIASCKLNASRIPIFDDAKLENTKVLLTEAKVNLNIKNNILNDCKNGVCPTCKKDFSSNDHTGIIQEIRESEREIEKLSKDLNSLLIEKNNYEKMIKDNEERKKLKLAYENKKALLEAQYNNDVLRLKTIKHTAIDDIEKDRLIYTNQIEEKELISISKDTSIQSKELQIVNMSDSINNKKLQLAQFTNFNTNLLDLEISNLSKKIKNYDNIVSYNKVTQENNENNEKEKANDLILIQEKVNQITDINNKILLYSSAKTFLQKDFPNYVITKSIKQIKNKMNEIIENVYKEDYSITFKEKKGSIYVYYGKYKADVSSASGWEQQLFSIAYKLALLELHDYKFLLLDEPDSNSDSENSEIFFEYLINYLTDNFQCFIITHQDHIKDLISNYNSSVFLLKAGEIERIN